MPDDLRARPRRGARGAAAFFATLDGTNRYAVLYRIHEAKRPETRARRIETFVAMLARGEPALDDRFHVREVVESLIDSSQRPLKCEHFLAEPLPTSPASHEIRPGSAGYVGLHLDRKDGST